MMNNLDIELLSPAGSYECAKAAIDAGADAIYMGASKFGARAFAKSTIEDKIIDSIKLAKDNGKKFYLTINILFKQKELKEIFLLLDSFVDAGVDAFIVQDIGVSQLLFDRYKNVELHASTQMTITSSKAIKLLRELGFKQFVVARELTLQEIKDIKKEIGEDTKLEAFVHGSMCYCYSGACYMSSYIGGESGNRGRCKGPCRLQYSSGPEKYLLSMKDMCALDSLYALIKAGVSSFKIEGRMRQADYVAGVTKMYRKYIDKIIDSIKNGNEGLLKFDIKKDENKMLELYDKGGFTNYYDKHNGFDMIQRYERKGTLNK